LQNVRKYGLFVAVGAAAALLVPMILFAVIGNDDDNRNSLFFLPFSRSSNENEDNNLREQQRQMEEEKEEQVDTFLRGAVDTNSEGKQVSEKLRGHLCGSSPLPKNTEFIQEFQIPFSCAQPVGIAADSQGKVWVAATWTGHLLVFDPVSQTFAKVIEIPDWKTKGEFGSMVWGMKFDKSGNLWFSDQVNNAIWRYFVQEERFEMYRVPTVGSYPSQIDFDSSGRVWFSEIFGKKLGVIDPALAENNTTRGIKEYDINQVEFKTMGPVTVSSNKSNNNAVWFTTVSYPERGNISRFDMDTEEFTFYDLPKEAGVPVGIVEDRDGQLWVNDHASNLFFMFDPLTQNFVKYSTSLPTSRENTTTLPYWNLIKDNRVWFNEHEGNAIAYFDIENRTLVEYQIPTRGEIWGNTTNPLKFDLDGNGSAWFTEWTENKIGKLDPEKLGKLPLWLSLSKDKVVLDTQNLRGDQLEILVHPNRTELEEKPVTMTIASSVSHSGRLWNMTADFSENEFSFAKGRNGNGNPHSITLWLEPSKDLQPGNYTVTIGARYDSVTYNKVLDMQVR
jgi:virginiamycin B lyase